MSLDFNDHEKRNGLLLRVRKSWVLTPCPYILTDVLRRCLPKILILLLNKP